MWLQSDARRHHVRQLKGTFRNFDRSELAGIERTLRLYIRTSQRDPDRYDFCLTALEAKTEQWSRSARRADLDAVLAELRDTWNRAMVGRLSESVPITPKNAKEPVRPSGRVRLDRTLDLRQVDKGVVSAVCGKLVQQGSAAFHVIFDGPEGLGAALKVFLTRAQHISVDSDAFIAPWGMLCVPDCKEDARLSEKRAGAEEWAPRFWAYHHVIEHALEQCAAVRPTVRVDKAPIRAGAFVDEALPDSHRTFMDGLDMRTELKVVRDDRTLGDLLRASTFDRHVVYVCAHGVLGPAKVTQLEVTTREGRFRIGLGDVARMAKSGGPTPGQRCCHEPHLQGSPILYVNACAGGDFQSDGGASAVRELTRLGASCCVSPEVSVPKVLAAAHAEAFFQVFLDGDVEAGAQMLAVAHHLLRKYGNPIGLVYTLKGRFDAHLDLPKDEPAPGLGQRVPSDPGESGVRSDRNGGAAQSAASRKAPALRRSGRQP